MAYKIESKPASKNGWYTPAQAKAYYGKYNRTGVTVHWWGLPSQNPDSAHDNIVNYILGKAKKGTGSVNYVLSNKKITMLVKPDNVAWASQGGNATTVSIEFSPNLNAEGYKKGGWLIYTLEKQYKRKLKLYRHSDWFATQCPGSISLKKLRAEADKFHKKPAPAKKHYLIVKRDEGLSSLARRSGFYKLTWWNSISWRRIAKLNGSNNWKVYNSKLKPGQKVRVK